MNELIPFFQVKQLSEILLICRDLNYEISKELFKARVRNYDITFYKICEYCNCGKHQNEKHVHFFSA
jgi:hypothetical protein